MAEMIDLTWNSIDWKKHTLSVRKRSEYRCSQGQASIKTTMDRHIQVTDESLVNAIRQFERAALAIYEKRA